MLVLPPCPRAALLSAYNPLLFCHRLAHGLYGDVLPLPAPRRQEAQAAEAHTAAARSELADAQSRLKELEGQLRAKGEQVAEKDQMLKYVQMEVDRVQGAVGDR